MNHNDLEMAIDIRIYQRNGAGPLTLQKTFQVKQCDFLEMCKILGQFETLASRIEKENMVQP